MSNHQGVVEAVSKNKADFYSIKLPDAWYGTGSKNDPGLRQGDVVKFEWEANGNFRNIKKGTLTKVEGAAPVGNSQPRGFGDDARQKSIIYQSSRKDAIEIVKAAQSAGCLALPAKKGDAFEALLALVDDLTIDLANKATEADITKKANNAVAQGDEFDG